MRKTTSTHSYKRQKGEDKMICNNCKRHYFDTRDSLYCKECRGKSKQEKEKIRISCTQGKKCLNSSSIETLIKNGFSDSEIKRMVQSSRMTISFFRKQIKEAYFKNERKGTN